MPAFKTVTVVKPGVNIIPTGGSNKTVLSGTRAFASRFPDVVLINVPYAGSNPPAGPVGPVAPVAPCGPAGPCGPVGSMDPIIYSFELSLAWTLGFIF